MAGPGATKAKTALPEQVNAMDKAAPVATPPAEPVHGAALIPALPLIRRYAAADDLPTWEVFHAAVHIGAAGHYTRAELLDWVPNETRPAGWGTWLDRHFTVVATDAGRVVGFFMLEADGYLNMTFVRPAYRRNGLAGRLYAAILAEARARAMPRLTVWASRLAMPFLRRQAWVDDPAPPPRDGHPIASDGPQPIEWALKLDIGG